MSWFNDQFHVILKAVVVRVYVGMNGDERDRSMIIILKRFNSLGLKSTAFYSSE